MSLCRTMYLGLHRRTSRSPSLVCSLMSHSVLVPQLVSNQTIETRRVEGEEVLHCRSPRVFASTLDDADDSATRLRVLHCALRVSRRWVSQSGNLPRALPSSSGIPRALCSSSSGFPRASRSRMTLFVGWVSFRCLFFPLATKAKVGRGLIKIMRVVPVSTSTVFVSRLKSSPFEFHAH